MLNVVGVSFLVFAFVCILARLWRSRISPYLAARLPVVVVKPLGDGINAGLGLVEALTEHQLAALLAAKVRDNAAAKAAKDAADTRLEKLKSVLDPASPKAPGP